ncbi:hypothetical protein [Pedobacter kyonggii]|uniref:Uncharacterized protein n=1 Tax=Pedobacter kyonggii TaxID=1926871 RepID=A0A4Q9HCV6_9SPHI|nr:hypothetical protein [Pedobacter kyonggii]TBO42248.1 hypothetical protein EYS08_12040 [Pedobacter kyonggii]
MTDKEIQMQVWDKSIDVQMHFNNIELQIRNYALTLFTAIIAGIGYLLKEKINIIVMGYIFPSSAAAALIGIVIMCAFYFMDKYWYHLLLQGSVKHALAIETIITDPALKLTSAIGASSKVKLLGWDIDSSRKYYFFYYPLILIFLVLYLALLKWA